MFYLTDHSIETPFGEIPSERALSTSARPDLAKARAFVQQYGSPLDRLLLAPDDQAAMPELLKPFQNNDGSWNPGLDLAYPQYTTAIAASAVALQLLIALELSRALICHRTLHFLERAQDRDGSWAGDSTLTAMIAGCLYRHDPDLHGASISRALDWLRKLPADSYRSGGPLCWYALALFGADTESSAIDGRITGDCWRALLASRDLHAFELAAVLEACYLLGLARSDRLVAAALSKLVRLQQPDGGWPASVPQLRARYTVAAMRVLRLWPGVSDA